MDGPESNTRDLDREEELSQILSSYLSAVDAGERPDREALLERYPHLASRLRSYFAGEDELGGLRTAVPPPEADDASEPEEEIGDYELLSEIARGGMGVVYRARQKSLKRIVALKMIVGGYLANQEVIARFYREAEAVARLDHPNIVPIYGIGEHDGRHFFSMKLFSGGSLVDQRQRLHEEPRLAAEMIKTVARAIHYAHLSGLLHRDLKPANVLLDSAGRPCVADFGLARAIASEQSLSLTDTGAILGTPLYMAPEQATGEKSLWGPAMDIYSLGAMLYEFLAGRPPFRGTTPVDILRAVIQDEPPPVRSIHPKAPLDLETICLKCLEKDPSRRYASAGELADDLDRFLRHETILARPPGLLRRVGRAAMRNRVVTAALLVAVAVALVFTAVTWYRAERTFDDALAAARAALERSDVDEAERGLYRLQETYGDLAPVRDLARAISRHLYTKGAGHQEEFLAQRGRVQEARQRWEDARVEPRPWQPPWERAEELKAWSAYLGAQAGIDRLYNEALTSLRRARRVAAEEAASLADIDKGLAGLLLEKLREASRFGAATVSPEFFREEIEALELPEIDRELTRGRVVSLQSEPPGAGIYCFRYETFEGRRLPLPFDPVAGAEDPRDGLLAEPYLEVETLSSPKPLPFEVGDRWLEVDGRTVRLAGDLAAVLEKVGKDDSIQVIVQRDGRKRVVAWTPFPASDYSEPHPYVVPGRLVNVRAQFGFSFTGYPLDFVEGSRVGVSQAGATVDVELPAGSYLFVLRKDGYRETRYPVAVPRTPRREPDHIRLFEDDALPGFVHVPGGPFICGGDRDAFQSLDIDERYVDDFLIGRFEVTVGEYLQFLNDREVVARTDGEGTIVTALESTRQTLERLGAERLRVVPRRGFRRVSNGWTADGVRRDAPVTDVSQLAALEYAHWFTEQRADGRRYRLPTDLEWEKAARGVDRRRFVWGDYFFWSLCWSYHSERYLGDQVPSFSPPMQGIHATDESVYGVRDLAGSVGELTDGRPRVWHRNTSVRGGDWKNPDELYLHAATRNGRLPESSGTDVGFRLAVSPLGGAE